MKEIIAISCNILRKISNSRKEILRKFLGPLVRSFTPAIAYSGSIIDIEGNNFSPHPDNNEVTIGGVAGKVIEASPTRLKIISAVETISGKIRVKVDGKVGTSTHDFGVKPYPSPGSGEDGPPVLYQGHGFPCTGDIPSTGILRVLVCLVNPTDRIPSNSALARNEVVTAWNNVSLFYNQGSYGALTVQVDIFNNWHTLSGDFDDYIDVDEIRQDVLSRLMAEATNHVQGGGEEWHLDDYQLIACVINLNSSGESIRARGGSSTNNFRFNELSINITTTNTIHELWVETSSDWEHVANEIRCYIGSGPFIMNTSTLFESQTSGRDVYAGAGKPQSIGDSYCSGQSNQLFSGIHNDSAVMVNSVNKTFYTVSILGMGDKSDSSTVSDEKIFSINNSSFERTFTNCVPVLGEHTCLKVFVSQQSGEISSENNAARQNVFSFEPPAADVPEAVYIPVIIRNPTNERAIVRMFITGVRIGYIVQFPHEWLRLDPLEERTLSLTVVPWLDYQVYKAVAKRYKQNKADYSTNILVTTYLPETEILYG